MPDSLSQIAARIEAAKREGVSRPGLKAEVSVSDLAALLHSWRERGRWIRERMDEAGDKPERASRE